jgi:hypothetical protein
MIPLKMSSYPAQDSNLQQEPVESKGLYMSAEKSLVGFKKEEVKIREVEFVKFVGQS